MQDKKTSFSGLLFTVAGVIATFPPIPIFREWNSQHLAALVAVLAGGAGLHFAADAKSAPKE